MIPIDASAYIENTLKHCSNFDFVYLISQFSGSVIFGMAEWNLGKFDEFQFLVLPCC